MQIECLDNVKVRSSKLLRLFAQRLLFLGALLTSLACGSAPEGTGGEIVIRNDILDKQYNSFVVDQVITENGLTPFSSSVHPGESLKLPLRTVTSLRFTRRYADYSMVYVVECPTDLSSRVTMKLIDVHSNRIGNGDCVLAKRGRSTRGMIEWE